MMSAPTHTRNGPRNPAADHCNGYILMDLSNNRWFVELLVEAIIFFSSG